MNCTFNTNIFMKRVTGIGGVFLKSKDAKALAAWYDKHLGFSFGENLYVGFKWINENNPAVPGNTIFLFSNRKANISILQLRHS